MAGFVTPTSALLVLVVLAVAVGLGRLARGDAQERAAGVGRRVRSGWRGRRFTRPTRRQVHLTWLAASALVAFALTRAVALPLFLIVFFALWLSGYLVLARLYR